MKAKTIVAVTTLLMSSGLVLASGEAQDQKAQHPEAAGAAAQQTPAGPGGGMPMMKMHENMRAQMEEINRTEDPDKRDKLIQTHMTDMQGMMKMMQGMHGGKPMKGADGMMGQGMEMPGGKKMDGQKGGMMEMMSNQKMMEKRMDMMQLMMDQMMQNQAAVEETRMIRDRRHDHRKMK
jgi:hypothetical protein